MAISLPNEAPGKKGPVAQAKSGAAAAFEQLAKKGGAGLETAMKTALGLNKKSATATGVKKKKVKKPGTHLERAEKLLAERGALVSKRRLGEVDPRRRAFHAPRISDVGLAVTVGTSTPHGQLQSRFAERRREEARTGSSTRSAGAQFLGTKTGRGIQGLVSFLKGR